MATMRVVQVSRPNGNFELTERKIPEPGAGMVRIKVEACGICHSDAIVKTGSLPIVQYPRVPGHEIAGVLDAIGPDVIGFREGQRVGVGWHGGYCARCTACRRGNFFACELNQITGITYDGGYADYMVARANAVATLPSEISAVDAAPLLCGGVTTFNAMRNCGAQPGDVVAIHGIGGLGHLGVQFANKMGFQTVAIARGKDKEAFARQLGAHHYIDSITQDPSAELQKLGGAKIIVATVTDAGAMSAALGGLGANGKLLVLGAPHEPISVPAGLLISGRRSVVGWYSGTSIDSQDTVAFAMLTGVRGMIETLPLERTADAYERMMSGKARFRVVITTAR